VAANSVPSGTESSMAQGVLQTPTLLLSRNCVKEEMEKCQSNLMQLSQSHQAQRCILFVRVKYRREALVPEKGG